MSSARAADLAHPEWVLCYLSAHVHICLVPDLCLDPWSVSGCVFISSSWYHAPDWLLTPGLVQTLLLSSPLILRSRLLLIWLVRPPYCSLVELFRSSLQLKKETPSRSERAQMDKKVDKKYKYREIGRTTNEMGEMRNI
ncbi:uncharacterized protein LOC143816831 [Ranitomeya variabilis]|uniref:uncharacterized protein LOC143816831 n=1 Tax=Ranitomeya variabilis TaxID=490064 RepID=UPI004057B6CC